MLDSNSAFVYEKKAEGNETIGGKKMREEGRKLVRASASQMDGGGKTKAGGTNRLPTQHSKLYLL